MKHDYDGWDALRRTVVGNIAGHELPPRKRAGVLKKRATHPAATKDVIDWFSRVSKQALVDMVLDVLSPDGEPLTIDQLREFCGPRLAARNDRLP